MRCYEKAIGQLVDLDVPTFKSFDQLADFLDKHNWELAVYEVKPSIPLCKIAPDMNGYAIISQRLPSGIIHATLTFNGIIPKQVGRQFAKPEFPVVLVTTVNPKIEDKVSTDEDFDPSAECRPIRSGIIC